MLNALKGGRGPVCALPLALQVPINPARGKKINILIFIAIPKQSGLDGAVGKQSYNQVMVLNIFFPPSPPFSVCLQRQRKGNRVCKMCFSDAIDTDGMKHS